MADQSSKPPRPGVQNIPVLLAKLRAAGVSEAHFHENGKLKAVAFAVTAPVVDGPEVKQHGTDAPATVISQTRAALDVLSGRRASLDNEDDKRGRN